MQQVDKTTHWVDKTFFSENSLYLCGFSSSLRIKRPHVNVSNTFNDTLNVGYNKQSFHYENKSPSMVVKGNASQHQYMHY